MVVHGSAENALKCIGCGGYEAENMEELRAHYKSEWHRHNLKRKVAGLAAIGEQDFMLRVAAYVGEQGADRQKKKEHLGKKAREKAEKREKHKDGKAEEAGGGAANSSSEGNSASNLPDFSHMTEEEFMEWRAQNAEQLEDVDSFFDRHRSESLHENLEYMAKKFGFFIPFLDKCNNLDGMLEYIRQKLTVGCVCLWCNKTFYSLGAVRNHMISKSHCKINFEGCEEEYQDFYDIDLSPNSLGVDEEDEDEWETDEEEEIDEDEMGEEQQGSSAMIVSTQGKKAEAARMSKKHAKQVSELSISGGEDGAASKVLGHRAFKVEIPSSPTSCCSFRSAAACDTAVNVVLPSISSFLLPSLFPSYSLLCAFPFLFPLTLDCFSKHVPVFDYHVAEILQAKAKARNFRIKEIQRCTRVSFLHLNTENQMVDPPLSPSSSLPSSILGPYSSIIVSSLT